MFRLLAVAASVMLILSGCSGDCTARGGGPSGVSFNISKLPEYPYGLFWRACVKSDCETGIFQKEDSRVSPTSIFVEYEPESADERVFVSLQLRTKEREVVFDGNSVVAGFEVSQPNGPHCEPTVYLGIVEATGTSGLVQIHKADLPPIGEDGPPEFPR